MKQQNKARLALILSVIVWAVLVVALLTADVKADKAEAPAPQNESLLGDDITATPRCYMKTEG